MWFCKIAKRRFVKYTLWMIRPRKFIGGPLRALRENLGVDQRWMAGDLGISVSYLSQLESDARPLTPRVAASLRRRHPALIATIDGEEPARRLAQLANALAAASARQLLPAAVEQLFQEWPDMADRIIALHAGQQQALEQLQIVEETMSADALCRPPWEAVRDWFHNAGNYVDELDRAAEKLTSEDTRLDLLAEELARRGLVVALDKGDDAPLSRIEGGALVLSAALPAESRRFQMAHRLAAVAFSDIIDRIIADSAFADPRANSLLRMGLANYGAGALTMPYGSFRAAARDVRHDIDRLARTFSVSFEQVCHRLSTLQRQGAEGIPVYFCRVDMAGNVTKRHSATRLQFARFGGSCPLWVVHEAVAIPDRLLVQHSETPDGARYISVAKGLVKPSGHFARAPRRYAVTLGWEAVHASSFVYSDVVDRTALPTPIGVSCRLCSRDQCDQRAFPPMGRDIVVNPALRAVVPYSLA